MNKTLLALLITAFVVASSIPAPCRAAGAGNYATITALEKYYREEKGIVSRYRAYSLKALEQGLPNIARLFRAFSLSETVHALSAKKFLAELGGVADDSHELVFDVQTTQTNLSDAVGVEIGEIESAYPEMLAAIEAEGVAPVMEALNLYWNSERHHLETFREIEANTGFTYFLLVEKIEKERVAYFICGVCGVTEIRSPPKICPVCKSPGEVYSDMDSHEQELWP